MNRLMALTGASLAAALLQNVCTGVLIVRSARLAVFASTGNIASAIRWFHQDTIRIPMLLLASIGAIADLVVLSWIKRLRSEPAPHLRLGKQSAAERRSQRLQCVLAVATLVLVAAETGSHAAIVHGISTPQGVRQGSSNAE